jgi:hypothetical protein
MKKSRSFVFRPTVTRRLSAAPPANANPSASDRRLTMSSSRCWSGVSTAARYPIAQRARPPRPGGRIDRIDHSHLLAALGTFPARGLVEGWLKAGVVDQDRFAATEEGAPKGVWSPRCCSPSPYTAWSRPPESTTRTLAPTSPGSGEAPR